jgi:hypothetical protein
VNALHGLRRIVALGHELMNQRLMASHAIFLKNLEPPRLHDDRFGEGLSREELAMTKAVFRLGEVLGYERLR